MPTTADFLEWAVSHLPHYFTEPPAAFHAEIAHDLLTGDRKRLARVAPRGHGKSVLATLAFPLYCICHKLRSHILIISQEQSLATSAVRDIRTELESNPRILASHGDLCEHDSEYGGLSEPPAEAGGPPDQPDSSGSCVNPFSHASDGGIPSASSPARDHIVRRPRDKWTESHFRTTTGVAVSARSVGASLRGIRAGCARPDLVICDDIEKDELVQSPDQRQKLEHWLRRVLLPAMDPHGRIFILGSIIHYDSLLANLADGDRWPRWDHKIYRAITYVSARLSEPLTEVSGSARLAAGFSEPHAAPAGLPNTPPNYRRAQTVDANKTQSAISNPQSATNPQSSIRIPQSEHRRALWPSRWPLTRLDQERETIGAAAFEQEYNARPVDEAARVFHPDWLRPVQIDPDTEMRSIRVMAVDPATGREGGDFTAIWTGYLFQGDASTRPNEPRSLDPSIPRSLPPRIYTRSLTLQRLNFPQQIATIRALIQSFQPTIVGIETVAYQLAMYELLKSYDCGTGFQPVKYVQLSALPPKDLRIRAASAMFENGTFTLSPNLDQSVLDQFLHYPKSKNDDAPDVCTLAIAAIRAQYPRFDRPYQPIRRIYSSRDPRHEREYDRPGEYTLYYHGLRGWNPARE